MKFRLFFISSVDFCWRKVCVVRKMLMRKIRCCLLFLAALVLTFSVANAPFCAFAVDEADARSAIAAAEEKIVVCYRAVAGADEAGADTSALLAVLNEAGGLLSNASLYRMKNCSLAFDFAVQSQEKLNGLEAEAGVLRENAMQQGHWDFMVNVVGSIVGAVVVVCGGFVVWFLLKRKYEKVA